jgi:hypothetical protein
MGKETKAVTLGTFLEGNKRGKVFCVLKALIPHIPVFSQHLNYILELLGIQAVISSPVPVTKL